MPRQPTECSIVSASGFTIGFHVLTEKRTSRLSWAEKAKWTQFTKTVQKKNDVVELYIILRGSRVNKYSLSERLRSNAVLFRWSPLLSHRRVILQSKGFPYDHTNGTLWYWSSVISRSRNPTVPLTELIETPIQHFTVAFSHSLAPVPSGLSGQTPWRAQRTDYCSCQSR